MFSFKKFNVILGTTLLLSACSATRDLSPHIDTSYTASTTRLTFSSPNFSAPDLPPITVSYAYVDTYLYGDFCKGNDKVVAQSSVNKNTNTQESVIPTGKVVAHIGYNTKALTGDSYYVMNINENAHYNITLTEARPLITSYSVAIDVFENGKSKPVKAINFDRKKDICS